MGVDVVLGLSGGVDSAAAAMLLREAGYSVSGLYLNNGFPGVEAAREAAENLSMPLTVFDSRALMEKHVCRPFAEAYLRGETPNPCILCNPTVKFASLLAEADRLGARYIATGHYAIARHGHLYRGRPENDQSYMLCRLEKSQIQRLLLPLGEYAKTEVRALAAEKGLRCAQKPDSMEICFIPDQDYAAWIEQRGKVPPEGDFLLNGKVVGRHRGIHHYTVGQRRGFGQGFGQRVYVSSIEPDTNRVILSAEDVYTDAFSVRDIHWIDRPTTESAKLSVRIRHSRQELPLAEVTMTENGAHVCFPETVRCPTPGQTAAFYDGNVLLGGGFIEK